MNWVGGARNRVRKNAERKLQKDFFERKRLVNKVHRIRPPLSRIKAEISQDLLHLQATASSTKPKPSQSGHIPKPPLNLEPRGIKKGGRLSMATRPQRDLELPMSPIGRSSALDFMDTSTVLSETFDGVRRSGEGSGGVTKEPPRVSTQKIPHRTLLESFGPPRINESDFGNIHDSQQQQQQQRTVPSLNSHLPDLNVSTMTESLFPPPAKRYKHQDNRRNMERMPHTSKKYSLDDLLEQDPLSHDLAPHTSRPEHSHAPLPPGGVSRHKERKRGMEQEEKGMGIRKGNSLFAIAKGGWQVPPLRTHKSKGQTGFNFSSWGARGPNPLPNRDSKRVQHLSSRQSQKEALSAGDESTELVLQYANVDSKVKENSLKNDAPPHQGPINQLVPKNEIPINYKEGRLTRFESNFERENLDPWKTRARKCSDVEASGAAITPWVSSVRATSPLLTENPFSKRNVPRVFAGPPVSTSIDFDESIFGPLRSRASTREKKENGPPLTKRDKSPQTGFADSLNTTRYNESILGPILSAKNEGKRDQQILKRRELDPPQRSHRSQLDTTQFNESVLAPIVAADIEGFVTTTSLGGKRKRSSFEIMMESLEKSCGASEHAQDQPSPEIEIRLDHCDQNSGATQQQVAAPPHPAAFVTAPPPPAAAVTAPPPPATFMPSHTTYKCKEPCLPTSGEIPTFTASEGFEEEARFCSTAGKGNISVLRELMCLEEEISSHYEDGLLSQNSPEDIGENSEDPIYTHIAKGRNEGGCPFDSSQESESLGAKKPTECNQFLLESSHHATPRPHDDDDNSSIRGTAVHECGEPVVDSDFELGSVKPSNKSTSELEAVRVGSTGEGIKSTSTEYLGSVKPSIVQELPPASTIATQTDDIRSASTEYLGSVEPQELPPASTIATQMEGYYSKLVVLPSSEPKKKVANRLQSTTSHTQNSTGFKALHTDFEQKRVEWNATSENLTIGLELHRVISGSRCNREKDRELVIIPALTCEEGENKVTQVSIAVQVQDTDISTNAGSLVIDANALPPDQKETESLWGKIQKLEEKLLSAENLVLWQSLVIRLHEQENL